MRLKCVINDTISTKSVLIIIILSRSNKSFHEESLIEEAWDGSVTTTKEEKETYPMLSVHLCGGQFKRKFISVFFTKLGHILGISPHIEFSVQVICNFCCKTNFFFFLIDCKVMY